MTAIPLVALCGFLGSGKTTLLRRWRRERELADAALVVHDLSEFGLDAELLAKDDSRPVAGVLKNRVAALHGKHAREELHESLGKSLGAVHGLEPRPPLVLCESTGAARPWPLIRALCQDPRFVLRHFIVTVDALNLHRDFADGQVLADEGPRLEDSALIAAAEVLAEQIAFASVIILTKTDTVPASAVKRQTELLHQLQARAAIGHSAQAGLLLQQMDGVRAPDYEQLKDKAERLGLSDVAATIDQVEAEILSDRRPFHPRRLFDVCHSHLATGLYRTKGFLWLASRPGQVLLWQQSGSQIALELTGYWRAELVNNPEGTLLPEEIEELERQLRAGDPVFGDRRNQLTLLGLSSARQAFATALRGALCTDEEVEAWKAGASFEDPWPKSLRRLS